MDYTELSEADRLLLARDRLRGLESDHYRQSIAPEPGADERLKRLEEHVKQVREEVKRLEKEVE